jgi:8-oxo-dGTP pyrophosphatase MutT (NUDIX family)
MGALSGQIRGLALAIIRKNGKILVSPGYDAVKNSNFYRLLGGGIDYGESSIDALHREFKEELDVEITNCKLLTVRENIFTFNGKPYHEICFIYEAEFTDPTLYKKEEFKILDCVDKGDDGKVIWLKVDASKEQNIFPAGVKDFI